MSPLAGAEPRLGHSCPGRPRSLASGLNSGGSRAAVGWLGAHVVDFLYSDSNRLLLREVGVPVQECVEAVPAEVHAQRFLVNLVLLEARSDRRPLGSPAQPFVDI